MKKKVQPPNFKPLTQHQKIFFWLGGAFGALIILTISCYHFAYWHKIYPGISVIGYPLGNQTLDQAQQKI